ncbi:hypothetical protein [Streptomyces europaeiscabiei]|uniref:hypothetical protein n=1 Tax=Streptomyces europaeiscabiei TaxID=146819 RepID=UPI002E25F032|nr:hypothetical protein OG858_13705 [Streptomyces europaeiscabiei]
MSGASRPTVQDWLDNAAGADLADILAQGMDDLPEGLQDRTGAEHHWHITAACWIARAQGLIGTASALELVGSHVAVSRIREPLDVPDTVSDRLGIVAAAGPARSRGLTGRCGRSLSPEAGNRCQPGTVPVLSVPSGSAASWWKPEQQEAAREGTWEAFAGSSAQPTGPSRAEPLISIRRLRSPCPPSR